MMTRWVALMLGVVLLAGCGFTPFTSGRAGHLLIVGGGLDDDLRQIYERFLKLAAIPGPPRLVVITTAIGTEWDRYTERIDKVEALRAWAPGVPVEVLHRTDSTAATVTALDRATGVLFTGGDQAKLTQRYRPGGKETPERLAMKRLLARGGVIAGCSAGDAMMGEVMIQYGGNWSALTAPNRPGAEYKPLMSSGMAFLPWAVTDSHFFERDRAGRLVVALEQAGRRLGIGVGEDAAVEIDLATGVLTGVTSGDSLLVDVCSLKRTGQTRTDARARLIRQGDRISLPQRLKSKLSPPPAAPDGPVQTVLFVDPGQNRQLALWRVFMGATRPGSGRWEVLFDDWALTAWSDGHGEVIFKVNPVPEVR